MARRARFATLGHVLARPGSYRVRQAEPSNVTIIITRNPNGTAFLRRDPARSSETGAGMRFANSFLQARVGLDHMSDETPRRGSEVWRAFDLMAGGHGKSDCESRHTLK